MSTMTISRIYTTVPDDGCTPVQQEVLHLLERLHIPYQYVEHDPADTMEDCRAISEALNVAVYMAKNALILLSVTNNVSVAFQKNPPFSST